MISRRRLLQVFAVAPFAPWKEILEEAAKPKIFYSLPPDPKKFWQAMEGMRDYFAIEWPVTSREWSFTTQDTLNEMHMQNIAYRYGIPCEQLEVYGSKVRNYARRLDVVNLDAVKYKLEIV